MALKTLTGLAILQKAHFVHEVRVYYEEVTSISNSPTHMTIWPGPGWCRRRWHVVMGRVE